MRLFPGSPPILWHPVFPFSFILSIHQISCLALQQYRCHFLACSQKQELGEHGYLLMGDSTLQWRDVSLRDRLPWHIVVINRQFANTNGKSGFPHEWNGDSTVYPSLKAITRIKSTELLQCSWLVAFSSFRKLWVNMEWYVLKYSTIAHF